MTRYPTVGLLYHPQAAPARLLADDLAALARLHGSQVWMRAAWDGAVPGLMADTDLLVAVGGDGTMLRAARTAIPRPISLFGVNMGRLGFLTEIRPAEAAARLTDVLDGGGRIETRAMLHAIVSEPGNGGSREHGPFYALNDAAVIRAGGRPIVLRVSLDGAEIDRLRADGVVVATATGSTGYNLSVGGPVLHPESESIVLAPIAAQVSRLRPLVLPADATVELRVESDLRGIASFDGQVDQPLASGATVSIRRGPHVARFIRFGGPADFYRNLTYLLDLAQRPDRRE